MKRLSLVFQICFWFLIMALQMAMAGDFHSFVVVPLFAGLSLIRFLQEREEKPQLKDDHLIIHTDRKLHKINFDELMLKKFLI